MRILALGITALALWGCGGGEPVEACYEVKQLAGGQTGQQNLPPSGGVAERRFVVALTGLPQLWSAEGAVLISRFETAFTLTYADPSVNNGLVVEMPRVRVTAQLVGDEAHAATSTPSSPGASARLALFSDCFFSDRLAACCPFGSQACQGVVNVQFERLDGDPFPEVIVGWKASAEAAVNPCPLGDSNPALSLTEQAP